MNRYDIIVNKYKQHALKTNSRSCHIAFLLKGKKILHFGLNQMNRNYYEGKSITSLHAEIDCLRKLGNNKIKNYSILVVNLIKDNSKNTTDTLYKDSRPCANCTSYLIKKGFKHVLCSTQNGIIEKINLKDYKPYVTLANIKGNARTGYNCCNSCTSSV
jgi:deoxycytidylate deaminase